ncbi:hypothetical protein [Shewanella marina]|uniref:hypothetical protein n=1 Tax=Shewanella marina TaxID=487319 RepID=UPI00046FEB32|nr:hypothetical protein [Shewanella marina]
MNNKILSVALTVLFVGGCANTEVTNIETSSNIPVWVMNPSSANGYSASNCVSSSGNFSIDRNHAISLTRITLAQNMQLKASILEKSYQKLNQSTGLSTTGSSFEQIAKQVTSISIQNSQVEQIALIEINDVEQVCALVTIPKTLTHVLFEETIGQDKTVDPTNKTALYNEFISQKTAKELEQQVIAL